MTIARWTSASGAKKVKLFKMSNFTFFHNVFYAICILKSFHSHISVVVCSFLEFGTVSKWCIWKWIKRLTKGKSNWQVLTYFYNSFFSLVSDQWLLLAITVPLSKEKGRSVLFQSIRCFIDHSPFPNKPWILRVCSTSLLKLLWEKEKLLRTSNLSFSHSVFYLVGELSATFIEFEIVVCKLCQFGRV